MHSNLTIKNWLDRILDHEAGFSDNPDDPGNWTGGEVGVGELKGTKYGIAANTYPNLDIKNLTLDDAVRIFIRDFLEPLKADRYADGVAYQLLDFAVNSGIGRATKELQEAVGAYVDGIIGPKTLAAIEQFSEAQLIMLVLAERLKFMTDLSTWGKFGKGWSRRIAMNLEHGAKDL